MRSSANSFLLHCPRSTESRAGDRPQCGSACQLDQLGSLGSRFPAIGEALVTADTAVPVWCLPEPQGLSPCTNRQICSQSVIGGDVVIDSDDGRLQVVGRDGLGDRRTAPSAGAWGRRLAVTPTILVGAHARLHQSTFPAVGGGVRVPRARRCQPLEPGVAVRKSCCRGTGRF